MLRTMLVLAVIALWASVSAQEPTAAADTSLKAPQAVAPASAAHQPDEAADRADPKHAGGAVATADAAVKSDTARARGPRQPPQHLTAEQALNARVSRMTRALELNETQQAKLREVLTNERQQLMQLRTSGTERVGPALAILDRTREEIRAMLNEEQKKKYPAVVPRDMTAPASADVDYWMGLTHPAPSQGAGPGH
jgi:hypothetical protein